MSSDVRAERRDLADELVAEDERGLDRALRPAVPGADVEVGSADAGAEHLDQHVAGAVLGLGDVHEPQPGLGLVLDECLHGGGSRHAEGCTAGVVRERYR
ncbi:hypothetical protein GCM10020254_71720 [Streptomyces goshikiensis]